MVGYGNAGRLFHSYLIRLCEGLELAGVASRNPETRERIVRERGVRAYEGLVEVLADASVDLVVLATPHDTHADYAVRVLEAGKHAITDKVICLGMAEFERMKAAQERSGKMLTVFHNRRWDGDWLTLLQLRDDGRLGDLRWVEMAWNRHGPWRGWRGSREKGGGRLYDLGAHLLDQILLLFRQPVVGVMSSIQREWPGFDVESQSMLTLHFEDGAVGVVDTGCLTRWQKPRFHAAGTKGTFVKFGVDAQEEAMKAGDIDAAHEPEALFGRLLDDAVEHVIPTIPGRWRGFYENVVATLNGEAAPAVTLEQMRRLVSVYDAAWESERTGQMVRPRA